MRCDTPWALTNRSCAKHSTLYGGWVFDCSADLPDFTFGVEDTTITVPSDYINYVRTCPLSPKSDAW